MCFIHQREHTFHWTRLNSEVFFSLCSLKILLYALWVFVLIRLRYMSVLWEALKIETWGAIHSTKIPTGPTGKRGPPQKVDPFFRNFSGWTEPIHWVLDRNFRKVWLNGSRPWIHAGPYGMPFSLQSPSQPCFGCHATLPRLPERLFSLRITQVPLYSETPQTKKFVNFS